MQHWNKSEPVTSNALAIARQILEKEIELATLHFVLNYAKLATLIDIPEDPDTDAKKSAT